MIGSSSPICEGEGQDDLAHEEPGKAAVDGAAPLPSDDDSSELTDVSEEGEDAIDESKSSRPNLSEGTPDTTSDSGCQKRRAVEAADTDRKRKRRRA